MAGTSTSQNFSDEDMQQVLDLVECSICLDLCQGQISQCKNGHNICASHCPRLSECPTCLVPYSMGTTRNLVAEKIVQISQRRAATNVSAPPMPPIVPIPRTQISSRCQYSGMGCSYENGNRGPVLNHELNCHYRPITCCFTTDGCHNAQIRFRDYINHLQSHHGVKLYSGTTHSNDYVVNSDDKLVREGSSSLFILEAFESHFLVRAKQNQGLIHVWVAIHGQPQDGRKFKAEIEFEFPEDEDEESESDSEEDDDDDDDFTFRDVVRLTSRMDLQDICNLAPVGTQKCLHLPEEDVRDNLATEVRGRGRGFEVEFWSISVSISRN